MNIDTDRVISEVRVRPALWDSSHELYKDRDTKIKAWLEVCQEVIPHFDGLSAIEKKLTEKQVQQRWKTARDAYVRSKTSDSGKRKKYLYFDCMHFLEKIHQEGKELTSDSSQANTELEIQNTRKDILSIGMTSSNLETHYAMPTTSRGTNASRRYRGKFHRGFKKVQRTRKTCDTNDEDFKKEMLILLKDNMKLMQNDDMSFFYSLLPITQTFDNNQKLVFRSEVLKKAMEISSLNSSRDPLELCHEDIASESQTSQAGALFPKKENDEFLESTTSSINI